MQAPSSVSKPSGVYRVQAEINVTPLVDVMLVLLIVFMVTAPMIAAGLHVNLPQAKAAQKLDPKPPVILTFSTDKTITLDGEKYPLEKIIEAVEARLGDDKSQPIHLRADRDASYGDVVGLMDLLAANGLTRLAVLTGPAGKSETLKADTQKPEIVAPALCKGRGDDGRGGPDKTPTLPNGGAAAFLLFARLRLTVTGVSALAHVAILVALGLHAQNVTVLAPLNIDLIPQGDTMVDTVAIEGAAATEAVEQLQTHSQETQSNPDEFPNAVAMVKQDRRQRQATRSPRRLPHPTSRRNKRNYRRRTRPKRSRDRPSPPKANKVNVKAGSLRDVEVQERSAKPAERRAAGSRSSATR